MALEVYSGAIFLHSCISNIYFREYRNDANISAILILAYR